MDYMQTLLIVCPLIFLAGFVDSIAGGGGLISTPTYLVAGIPPQSVLACNKFSSFFGISSSLYRFLKSGNIHKKIAVVTVTAAIIGSAVGANLMLLVSDRILKILMLFLLPVILIFILVKRDFGKEKELLPHKKLIIYSTIISLVIGMYDGFFGPGAGTFLILAFTSILGFDILTASGNAKAVNFASNIAALVVFLINGKVMFAIAIPAAICNMIGSYIGSGLAIKIGIKVIKPVFVIVIFLLMGKILYDFNSL